MKEVAVSITSLGAFAHNNLIFTEGTQNRLGLGYLSRFDVVFDFPRSIAVLNKGPDFDRDFPNDWTGLHIIKSEGGIFVESVEEGSIAEKYGLDEGDRIVSISGRNIEGCTLFSAMYWLSASEKEVDITIQPIKSTQLKEVRLSRD